MLTTMFRVIAVASGAFAAALGANLNKTRNYKMISVYRNGQQPKDINNYCRWVGIGLMLLGASTVILVGTTFLTNQMWPKIACIVVALISTGFIFYGAKRFG